MYAFQTDDQNWLVLTSSLSVTRQGSVGGQEGHRADHQGVYAQAHALGQAIHLPALSCQWELLATCLSDPQAAVAWHAEERCEGAVEPARPVRCERSEADANHAAWRQCQRRANGAISETFWPFADATARLCDASRPADVPLSSAASVPAESANRFIEVFRIFPFAFECRVTTAESITADFARAAYAENISVFSVADGNGRSISDADGDSHSISDANGDSHSVSDANGDSDSLSDAIGDSDSLNAV